MRGIHLAHVLHMQNPLYHLDTGEQGPLRLALLVSHVGLIAVPRLERDYVDLAELVTRP